MSDLMGSGTMSRTALVAALLPFWGALILSLLLPEYFYIGLGWRPPAVLGLPLGFVMLFVAVVLAGLGFLALLASRSAVWSLLSFVFLTVPATLLVILTPATVLIVLNLSTG
jgi:hypothetical protein